MKSVYIKTNASGEIVGISSGSSDMPYAQPGFTRVSPEHPEFDRISIETHYVDSSGEIVKYADDLIEKKKFRPSSNHYWDVQTGWVDTTTVTEFKQRKSSDISAERERRNGLPIEFDGVMFDADEEAQRNVSAWMTNIAAGQNPPTGFVWRAYDNTNHPADAAFVVGLGNAITLRGTYLYQRSWIKKAEVAALTTAAEVKAYDVTTGW